MDDVHQGPDVGVVVRHPRRPRRTRPVAVVGEIAVGRDDPVVPADFGEGDPDGEAAAARFAVAGDAIVTLLMRGPGAGGVASEPADERLLLRDDVQQRQVVAMRDDRRHRFDGRCLRRRRLIVRRRRIR